MNHLTGDNAPAPMANTTEALNDTTMAWAEDQKARGRTLFAVPIKDLEPLVDWLVDLQHSVEVDRLRNSLLGALQARSAAIFHYEVLVPGVNGLESYYETDDLDAARESLRSAGERTGLIFDTRAGKFVLPSDHPADEDCGGSGTIGEDGAVLVCSHCGVWSAPVPREGEGCPHYPRTCYEVLAASQTHFRPCRRCAKARRRGE